MISPVVHIGAIAVSFLFVVMMFNIQIAEIHEEVLRYLPVSGIIGLILWWEMFFILDNETIPLLPTHRNTTSLRYTVHAGKVQSGTNLETLGNLIYTYYSVWFLVPSLILLVAMIGAIVLTMHRTTKVQRQDVFRRNALLNRGARLTEVPKQPQYSPLPIEKQIEEEEAKRRSFYERFRESISFFILVVFCLTAFCVTAFAGDYDSNWQINIPRGLPHPKLNEASPDVRPSPASSSLKGLSNSVPPSPSINLWGDTELDEFFDQLSPLQQDDPLSSFSPITGKDEAPIPEQSVTVSTVKKKLSTFLSSFGNGKRKVRSDLMRSTELELDLEEASPKK
jgi:NADH-ubiquinone oxidoreductase chain 6